jgi:predicted PurR-regulated permease PerM
MSNCYQKPSMPFVFWIGFCGFLLLAVFLFKAALLPFVLGIAVAYLLNPAVNRLGAFGMKRSLAALCILGAFLLVFVSFIGGISPIVYREISQLYGDLPSYIEKFWALTAPVTALIEDHLGGADVQNLETIFKENSASAARVAQYIMVHITSGGQMMLDIVSVAAFMPIVAYFMMKEWPHITAWLYDLIPRKAEKTVRELLVQIDLKISGFVRGQILVAVTLGIVYAVALSLAGLKYGFVIGLFSGFLSIIPMVGSVVGLFAGVSMAWFQSGDLVFAGIIAAIFVVGQVVEGNVLTPKLVGESIGLHPLWVFFAILAGGSLLGLLGMFLAVPVAAVVGVLAGYAIKKYKASSYYNNGMNDDFAPEENGNTPASP